MTEPTEHAGQQMSAEHGQPTPGMQLAARREQFNWTVDQVARQLNLAPRQVLAMETDDYGALPGMAVARGFIRAYAKLLKLDAAPMLAQIAQAPGAVEQAIPLRRAIPTTTFMPHRAASRSRSRGPGKLLLAGGLVLVALVAAGLISQRDRLAELVPASIGERLSAATVAAPQPAAETAAKPGRVVETEVAPPLSHADSSPQPSPAAPASVAPAAIPPEAATPAPSAQTPLAAPAPASALVLNFKQDSWVEVKRADNSTVVSRVMRAGSSESFDLASPLTLTVGNARGVEASVRGEPLNLAGTTRNNVARLTVK